jgi:hypothetical protein
VPAAASGREALAQVVRCDAMDGASAEESESPVESEGEAGAESDAEAAAREAEDAALRVSRVDADGLRWLMLDERSGRACNE